MNNKTQIRKLKENLKLPLFTIFVKGNFSKVHNVFQILDKKYFPKKNSPCSKKNRAILSKLVVLYIFCYKSAIVREYSQAWKLDIGCKK